MPMPSVNDLQTMYGAWNPQAYLEAQTNAGLERDYRSAELANQQEAARKASLENIWAQEDRPSVRETKRLTNRNLELTGDSTRIKNDREALTLEREQALQKLNLNADQRKALLQIGEDELKQADQIIEKSRRSLDPAEQEYGEKLYQLTGAARALRAKQAANMEMEKYKQTEESKRAAENNATAIKVANINQAGADRRFQPRTPAGVDFWTSFYKLKSAPDKHAALILEARKIQDTDPTGAAQMLEMAADIRNQAQAQIATPKPGSLDVGTVANMPVNPPPQIAPGNRSVSGPILNSGTNPASRQPTVEEMRKALKGQ